MGKYIGIDLGTTYSCMAYIDDNGTPVVINVCRRQVNYSFCCVV